MSAAASSAACVLVLVGALCAAPSAPDGSRAGQAVAEDLPEDLEPLRVRDALRQNADLSRRAQLRAAWLSADDDARAAAHGVLLALRDLDAAPGAPPSTSATSEALRSLRGRVPAEQQLLQRFADALTLELRPGAFEAREEGRGEFTVVRVRALWAVRAPPDEFVVNLSWLGPNGEELHARGEPVLYTALAAPGFDMYVRPPASAPGEWLMVPEVGFEGETACGIPSTVDCVADLTARLARLEHLAPLETARDPARELLARDVADVVVRGVPRLPGASVGAWLEHLEHGPASERPGDVVPRVLDGLPSAWELVSDVREPRCVLVLLDAFSEPPRAWFDGPGKRGWLEAARLLGARVLALPTPLDDAAIAALRHELAGDGVALVLVARGAAVADVLVRRAALAASVDGLALETELGSRAAPAPLAQPTLVLDAGRDEDGEETVEREGRAPLRWVRRRALPVVADLELPGLIATWWGEHESAREPVHEQPGRENGTAR